MYGMSFDVPVISFDFDNTYTLNPRLFLDTMKRFRNNGFEVVVVTYSFEEEAGSDFNEILANGFKVFFTGRESKHKFMKSIGKKVDVWVDDQPATIIYDMNPKNFLFDLQSPHM